MSISITIRKTGGFFAKRLECHGQPPWVNLYLGPGELKNDGRIELFTPAECDELIIAATKAKRLLSPHCQSVAEHSRLGCTLDAGHDGRHRSGHIVWGPGALLMVSQMKWCTAGREDPHVICELPAGHDGDHKAPGDEEGDPDITWTDNPPHHATPTGEQQCGAEDNRYICTAQEGHDGPGHVAYGTRGEVCHRWPVTAPEVEVIAEAIKNGTPVTVTDDEYPDVDDKTEAKLCHYCDVEPATVGDYCEACAPAVQLAAPMDVPVNADGSYAEDPIILADGSIDDTRYVDNPTPHSDDCDCENCVTFYAERNKQ